MKSSIKYDLSKLQTFVKGLDDKHQVQVGVFGTKSSRKDSSTLTNAEIGAIQEFGSFTRGIAPRSFLRMPIHTQTDQILKQVQPGAKELIAQGKMVMLLKRLGIACENVIQAAFASRGFGTWKANAPSTIKRKGSDSPLIDTAQLRRSIASRVVTI